MARTRLEVNVTRYETAAWEFEGKLTEDEALELVRTAETDPIWNEVHDEEIDPLELRVTRNA